MEIRFGEVPAGLKEAIVANLDQSRLSSLHKAAIQAGSPDEFVRGL